MSAYQDVSNKIKAHFKRYKKLPTVLHISLDNFRALKKQNAAAFTVDQNCVTWYASMQVSIYPQPTTETRVTRGAYQ